MMMMMMMMMITITISMATDRGGVRDLPGLVLMVHMVVRATTISGCGSAMDLTAAAAIIVVVELGRGAAISGTSRMMVMVVVIASEGSPMIVLLVLWRRWGRRGSAHSERCDGATHTHTHTHRAKKDLFPSFPSSFTACLSFLLSFSALLERDREGGPSVLSSLSGSWSWGPASGYGGCFCFCCCGWSLLFCVV